MTRYPILFEDEWLLAVDKPDRILSHPNQNQRERSAFEGSYDFNQRRFQTPSGPLWLIHRLDQDTSGVLLASKKENVTRACRELFACQKIQKTYRSLLEGKIMPTAGTWRNYLEKRVQPGKVRSISRPGIPPNAELRYQILSTHPWRGKILSLAKITLMTGRTHQIRVQGAWRGHPLAGDRIYGDFELNHDLRRRIQLRRLFLHAEQLEFQHPVTAQKIRIEAPLPPNLAEPLGFLTQKTFFERF